MSVDGAGAGRIDVLVLPAKGATLKPRRAARPLMDVLVDRLRIRRDLPVHGAMRGGVEPEPVDAAFLPLGPAPGRAELAETVTRFYSESDKRHPRSFSYLPSYS